MFREPDMTLWQGRVDEEDDISTWRWHQRIRSWDGVTPLDGAATLLGFACDEGVQRNQGRPGARNGPDAIRRALANCAFFGSEVAFDGGTIVCDDDLEAAQQELATTVARVLGSGGFPVILGGGHEVAWGSFLGIRRYHEATDSKRRLGIINFDAHFDLRSPRPRATSGTPFRQIGEWSQEQGLAFRYAVYGINPTANTTALFNYASTMGVSWHSDVECAVASLDVLSGDLRRFVADVDELYLTVCLDVFNAAVAPGVSAPSAVGVNAEVVIYLIREAKRLADERGARVILGEVAEMNPAFDIDGRTAKLAARLVHELVAG